MTQCRHLRRQNLFFIFLFEFFGVYDVFLDRIKWISDKVRSINPNSKLRICSNATLLNPEIIKFINDYGLIENMSDGERALFFQDIARFGLILGNKRIKIRES